MSLPVDLRSLRSRIDEFGPVAFLVTVDDQGAAHVVSVEVDTAGDRLVVPTGRTTSANLERNPHLTLLWPLGPDPAYSMLVDAVAVSLADDRATATVEAHSAVLHRVAGATGTGPTCLPVAEPHTDD